MPLGIALRAIMAAGQVGGGGSAPTAPSSLAATADATGLLQIALTWTDNSSDEYDFELQYDTDSGFGSPTSVYPALNATGYTVDGLTAGTTYYFRIRARGAGGNSDWSASANDTVFAPGDVSGLQIWLKADAGTYEDTAKTTPAADDGDPVQAWADQSGNGNDFTEATNPPSLLLDHVNGLSVIRAEGASSETLANGTSIGMQTVFVVGRPRNYAALEPALYSGTTYITSTNTGDSTLYTANPSWVFSGGTALINGDAEANQNLQEKFYVIELYGTTVTGALTLFKAGSTYGDWDLAEVMVYNAALTSGERTSVRNYLMSRWGVGTQSTEPRLELWLDASDADTLFQDTAGTTPADTDGDPVLLWQDKSGNGYDYTEATNGPTLKTALINSLNAIRSDGSNDILANATSLSIGTIFVVGQLKATTGFEPLLGRGGANYILMSNNNSTTLYTASPSYASQSGAVVWMDGALYSSGDLTAQVRLLEMYGAFVQQNINLFYSTGVNAFGAWDVGEIRIYSEALTDAERNSVRNELAAKWGITLADYELIGLTTPTYDGSGQAIHPSVYDAGSGNVWPTIGSPQHRYWMAMTPYPNGDDQYENPSILVSDDGEAWSVPSGLTNPIDATPTTHNADTELLHGEDGDLYVYYIDVDATGANMNVRSSSDGITWSAETTLFSGSYAASPTVFWDGSQYVMIYVDYENPSAYVLRYRTCATPDGTWSAESSISLSGTPSGTHPWNIFARPISGGTYLALIHFPNTGSQTGGSLYWATSPDGTTWTVGSEEIATGDWLEINDTVYRACFTEDSAGMYSIYVAGRRLFAGWSMWLKKDV